MKKNNYIEKDKIHEKIKILELEYQKLDILEKKFNKEIITITENKLQIIGATKILKELLN